MSGPYENCQPGRRPLAPGQRSCAIPTVRRAVKALQGAAEPGWRSSVHQTALLFLRRQPNVGPLAFAAKSALLVNVLDSRRDHSELFRGSLGRRG